MPCRFLSLRAVCCGLFAVLMLPMPVAFAQNPTEGIIQFEKGSNQLTPVFQVELRDLGKLLQTDVMAGTCLRITGHSDTSGDANYNKSLSKQRAEVVANFLQTQGVSSQRIVIDAKGEETPLPGISGRDPRNRRVEFAAKYTPSDCVL